MASSVSSSSLPSLLVRKCDAMAPKRSTPRFLALKGRPPLAGPFGKKLPTPAFRCRASPSPPAFGTGFSGDVDGDGGAMDPMERELREYLGGVKDGKPFTYHRLLEPPTKPPNYYLIAAGVVLVILYRHTIFRELSLWFKMAVKSLSFLAISLRPILEPVLKAITKFLAPFVVLGGGIGLFVRDMYTLMVTVTQAWPIFQALLVSTLVLSLAETISGPEAVKGQSRALAIVMFGALGGVLGLLPSILLLLLLVGVTTFSLFMQRKDPLSAFTPAALVLCVISAPWLRVAALTSFLALALHQNWMRPLPRETRWPTPQISHPKIILTSALVLVMCISSRFLYARHLLWLAK